MRLGVVGAGGIAARHLAALEEDGSGGVSVVAHLARGPERAAAAAVRFGGTAYTDIDAFIAEGRPDAVLVTLPPAEHGAVERPLIAAVIYTESRFRDQTSPVGAKGLMQLMPETADYIARKSGGTRFERADLATPQINIAYGTWYLRYLLDKYKGNTILTLAAYNGGEGKVDEWRATAAARGERFRVASHVPFPETRDYVTRVLDARRDYRRNYSAELGLT